MYSLRSYRMLRRAIPADKLISTVSKSAIRVKFDVEEADQDDSMHMSPKVIDFTEDDDSVLDVSGRWVA